MNEQATEQVINQSTKGDRGELGTATPSKTIKQRWQAAKSHTSLKTFARGLAKQGDETAKAWLANKLGAMEESRSEKNIARCIAEANASRLTRRKSGKK